MFYVECEVHKTDMEEENLDSNIIININYIPTGLWRSNVYIIQFNIDKQVIVTSNRMIIRGFCYNEWRRFVFLTISTYLLKERNIW